MIRGTKLVLPIFLSLSILSTTLLYSQFQESNSDFSNWFNIEVEEINKKLTTDSEYSLQRSLELLEASERQVDNTWFIAKAKERVAVSYYYLNDLNLSNKYNFESLLLFDSLQDKENKALVLNNLGWNYRVQDRNEMAILYFEESLKLFRDLNNKQKIQAVLNNLGTAYRRDPGKFNQALEVFRESLEINRTLGNKTWEAYNLNNIGLILFDMGKYREAIQNLHEAIAINQELENKEEVCRNFLNLSLVHLFLDQIDSAETYLLASRALLDEFDYPKTEYVYWDYKVEFEKKQGNYQDALEAQIRKDAYEWEQHKEEYENKISEWEVKYNFAIKEQQLKEAQNKTRRVESIALLMLLISIIVVLVKVYLEKTKWLNKSQHLYQDISKKVKQLKDLNDENERIKENLQKLIRVETEKITKQNEKLKKYAFINAHLLRGPLARIMGLVNVIKLENKDHNDQVAFTKLYESSNELDSVIRNISDVLNKDNELRR